MSADDIDGFLGEPHDSEFHAQIPVTAIRKHDHDYALRHFFSHPELRGQGSARGVAHEEPFLPDNPFCHVVSGFRINEEVFIREAHIEDAGDNRAFAQELYALDAVKCVVGMNGDDLYCGTKLPDRLSRAHYRAAGSDAGYEMGHVALCLVYDFRAGRQIMGHRIRGIVELVRLIVSIGVLPDNLLCHPNSAVRPFEGTREDQFGAETRHDFLPFCARGFWYHNPNAVSFHGPDHSICDAGIAGCGIENDFVAGQKARSFGLADHTARRPVLYRASGVSALHFGKNRNTRTEVPCKLRDLD